MTRTPAPALSAEEAEIVARFDAAPDAPEAWDNDHRDVLCREGVPLWACCGLPGACCDC